jgi:predicted RecA/RadA family phage recombinase
MAQAVFVHEGCSIDYTPGADVGVAKQPIKANQLGALAVEGVFDFAKATGVGTALAAGTTAYWDDAANVATATAAGNKQIGKVVKAAADGDATVRVRMNQ